MSVEEEEKKIKTYELTYLSKSGDSAVARSAVSGAGGVVLDITEPVKVRLEYQIRKTPMAFLGTVKFEIAPEEVKGLTASLRLEQGEIIRFIITNPIISTVGRPDMARDGSFSAGTDGGRARAAQAGSERAAPARAARVAELTNEALERKIEEILK